MSPYIPNLIAVLFILGYALVSVWIFRRKRARRQTMSPEEFVLLRRPGETQQREIDRVSEELANMIMFWAPLSLTMISVPFWIRDLFPRTNLLALLVCCLVLFIISIYVVVTKTAALLEERANRRLGYRGERHVAEQLQPLIAKGWAVFHDVPKVQEKYQENIDHVIIAPYGVVVVETKTYSKPRKETGKKDLVTFDGDKLIWPFFADDRKPLEQVKRCANWLQTWIRQHCGVGPPVFQMIAIPGWHVNAGQHYKPRVTSGRAVVGALEGMMVGQKEILSKQDIQRIAEKLDELCRDVRD
ncbi:MAG: NERD domain-containing protein [Prosthecobacter sp.]|jgi:hypothetical protein|uniref:nuclease-related domain-containing protein n=1 Tax=Prosthecobacter sp. TaxID=1965333 RepID=UPI0019D9839A|nr:NERD domain-containing protein [Prosthecobacter sp.]MBE2283029.1 NERD domain-containing protein [Prosthecobacter sp.]